MVPNDLFGKDVSPRIQKRACRIVDTGPMLVTIAVLLEPIFHTNRE